MGLKPFVIIGSYGAYCLAFLFVIPTIPQKESGLNIVKESPAVILPQFSHKTRPYISVSFGQSKLVRFRFNLTVRAILIDKMDTVTSITSTKNHSAIIN